jgi:hypothetical protein
LEHPWRTTSSKSEHPRSATRSHFHSYYLLTVLSSFVHLNLFLIILSFLTVGSRSECFCSHPLSRLLPHVRSMLHDTSAPWTKADAAVESSVVPPRPADASSIVPLPCWTRPPTRCCRRIFYCASHD